MLIVSHLLLQTMLERRPEPAPPSRSVPCSALVPRHPVQLQPPLVPRPLPEVVPRELPEQLLPAMLEQPLAKLVRRLLVEQPVALGLVEPEQFGRQLETAHQSNLFLWVRLDSLLSRFGHHVWQPSRWRLAHQSPPQQRQWRHRGDFRQHQRLQIPILILSIAANCFPGGCLLTFGQG